MDSNTAQRIPWGISIKECILLLNIATVELPDLHTLTYCCACYAHGYLKRAFFVGSQGTPSLFYGWNNLAALIWVGFQKGYKLAYKISCFDQTNEWMLGVLLLVLETSHLCNRLVLQTLVVERHFISAGCRSPVLVSEPSSGIRAQPQQMSWRFSPCEGICVAILSQFWGLVSPLSLLRLCFATF